MIQTDIKELNERIQKESAFIDMIEMEMNRVIVGQKHMVERLMIGLLSNGHILLEGVPGLAKTLAIKSLANIIDAKFSRIQFTPDLMPSDIIGTEILDQDRKFRFIRGPVFANIILADEINRTPPKTQSALLEAMQEKAVTVAGVSHKLEEPFFVLATQNPIEQEGTYPLPEAQLDRFMFNIWLGYPTFEQEIQVVKNTTTMHSATLNVILTAEEISYFQDLIRRIPVADNVYQYAVKLASLTRPGTPMAHAWANNYLTWGAGPRASQYLVLGAKCHAAVSGKYSPDIADVQAVATSILRHRFVRNYKAEAEGISVDNIIEKLL